MSKGPGASVSPERTLWTKRWSPRFSLRSLILPPHGADNASTRRGSAPRTTRRRRSLNSPIYVTLICVLSGCATPAEQFTDLAARYGFKRDTVAGSGFVHAIYVNRHIRSGRALHVYLGGDGTPWVASRPAIDPTPRRPLVLDLMARDQAPAIYLGRPCYHGMASAAACNGWLWTNGRYAETVVASMTAALGQLVGKYRYSKVVLIGHSGGGALAMLIAPRVRETVAVVTIGANLDIDAWTAHRGFGRLNGSLNPARQPPLDRSLTQLHFAGGRDRVVPVEVVKAGLRGQAALSVVGEYDHSCCWTTYWPKVLRRLTELEDRP